MSRHGYTVGDDGSGPHTNVLGHPLLDLPLWIDGATDDVLDDDTMSDILESSVSGYLSVRAEDDYVDGHWDQPKEAMMVSGVFRARHQALLARHIGDERFWSRFEEVWHGYAGAMLEENRLNDVSSEYGPEDFDRVLLRSQPLEIPADAVLSLKGGWDRVPEIAALVERLTKATQLFDDFVDAPEDLASGNYTWMVRRLEGMEGEVALRRGMVTSCDEVFAEVFDQLDQAVLIGTDLGIAELEGWVHARKSKMELASRRMYAALFEGLASSGSPGMPTDA